MLNFIFGAAGHAREVDWLIEEIFEYGNIDYRAQSFVTSVLDEKIGVTINGKKVIGEPEFFKNYASENVNCILGVGNPILKHKIIMELRRLCKKAMFPSLIHPSVSYDKRKGKIAIGEGSLICSNSIVTTDVFLGECVTVNTCCTVAHDCKIGDFVTISPGVNLAGGVQIENFVFIGVGACVSERVKIAANSIIGAGATVIRDIEVPGIYVGTPARKVK